jgi:hypothetical protein
MKWRLKVGSPSPADRTALNRCFVEVRIRTTRLLMTVESFLEEQKNYPRAVIFGAVRVGAMG